MKWHPDSPRTYLDLYICITIILIRSLFFNLFFPIVLASRFVSRALRVKKWTVLAGMNNIMRSQFFSSCVVVGKPSSLLTSQWMRQYTHSIVFLVELSSHITSEFGTYFVGSFTQSSTNVYGNHIFPLLLLRAVDFTLGNLVTSVLSFPCWWE